MYIVAQDGSGDFTSIQAAIDAIPLTNRAPFIVLVRMEEFHEKVILNKDNVRLIGEARDRTVLTWNGCAKDLDEQGNEKGTFLSYTLLITGRNVEVENITIRNDAGDGRDVGQAVAVYAAGDRGVFRNVNMIGSQDTLFCGPTMPKVRADALPRAVPEGVPSVGDCPAEQGRLYFENCFIRGDVDFIFGPYRCWFERCTLYMNQRGGMYTAANTPKECPYGLVFHQCKVTGECEPGMAFLGRPWRAWARTVFLSCEMDECVNPQGFSDWDAEKPVTERYAEYGTTGARADQSTRHPAQKRMTAQEAAVYTVREVLGGWDGWNPAHRVPTWFLCGGDDMADWGGALARLADAHVISLAKRGLSSKGFVADKWLAMVELCLRPGDTLLVQFARGDAQGDCHTDARTTYPGYLSMFIDAARRQRALPVLLTPMALPGGGGPEGAPLPHAEYASAMRALADERGVTLLDLEPETARLLAPLDDAMEDGGLSFDGAVAAAQAVLQMLKKSRPGMPEM